MRRCIICLISALYINATLLTALDVGSFHYQRAIIGARGTWHSLTLPPAVLTRLQPSMNDVRIVGRKSSGDSIEVPYVLDVSSIHNVRREVPHRMLNSGWTHEGFTCTLQVNDTQTVNHVQLNLVPLSHFSSDLILEGSDDNHRWVSIARTYCRQSADQSGADANTIDLELSPCRFAYYRASFHDFDSVRVGSAVLSFQDHSNGIVHSAAVRRSNSYEDTKLKRTIFDVTLNEALHICQAEFTVSAPHDYERAVRVLSLTDSVNINGSWHYRFHAIWNGTLSSARPRIAHFDAAFTSILRVEVENRDDAPLTVESVNFQYADVHLRAQFTGADSYSLVYGSEKARAPEYDLAAFTHTIPTTLEEVTLGDEILLSTAEAARRPLFDNKLWLYGIMSLIIVALAGAMIRMMRAPKQQS